MRRLRSTMFHRPNEIGLQPWVYPTSFLLAVLMLMLIVATAIYLAYWPEDGVGWAPHTNQITRIDPAGPAAGILQLGDTIIIWDGVPINQITQLYADKDAGDEVQFTILRDGRVSSKSFRLFAPSIPILVSRLEPLFIAVVFWVLGIVVFAFNSTDIAARLFHYTFSYIGCGVLVLGALSITGLSWPSHFFYFAMWLLGPLAVHLHLYFPAPITIPYQRRLLVMLYTCAVIAGLASFVLGIVAIRSSQGFRLVTYLFLIANLTTTVALLGKTYRTTTLALARQRIRLVVLGTVLAIIPVTSLGLIPNALFGQPIISYNLAFAFLIIVPLTYGTAILRYRLIQVDQYISRRFANFVLIIILSAIYLLLYELSYYLSVLHPELTLPIGALFVLLIATTFMRVRNRLQKVVDWAFYEGWYDFGTAVQKMNQALDQVDEPAALAAMLPRNLAATMKLECSCLILTDQVGHHYGHLTSCPACPIDRAGRLQIDTATVISQHLIGEHGPILGSVLRQKLVTKPLTLDEQRLLSCTQERVWVPLMGRETLLGILILGPKQCDDVFDYNDFKILEVVARQASITIQNTALLLEVQQRADDIERLHQELLRAREEERKRLARELHDEVMQALVGLNYGLSKLDTLATTAEASGPISKLLVQLQQVMDDLRRICKELRPPTLDSLGLAPALRSLVRETEAKSNLSVELIVEGNKDAKLPEELEVCLFRILQEALTNVQKHARATHVSVEFMIEPSEVRLQVQDDGCGFAIPVKLSQFMDVRHFGLVGVRERLDLVGGKLHLSSTPGTGTCLEARIALPYQAPHLITRIER